MIVMKSAVLAAPRKGAVGLQCCALVCDYGLNFLCDAVLL